MNGAMKKNHTIAAQTLLQRILELHRWGCTPQEIASKIFTTELETVKFRVETLIEIILAFASRETEDKNE